MQFLTIDIESKAMSDLEISAETTMFSTEWIHVLLGHCGAPFVINYVLYFILNDQD
jgi:hypothetical protein